MKEGDRCFAIDLQSSGFWEISECYWSYYQVLFDSVQFSRLPVLELYLSSPKIFGVFPTFGVPRDDSSAKSWLFIGLHQIFQLAASLT